MIFAKNLKPKIMSKGKSYHPEFVKAVLRNEVPEELKHLVTRDKKCKWSKNPPEYIGSEYYESLKWTEKRKYPKIVFKLMSILRMNRLRCELMTPGRKRLHTEGNEEKIIRQLKKATRYLDIKKCLEILGLKRSKFLEINQKYNIKKCPTPIMYLYCGKVKNKQLRPWETFRIIEILKDEKYLSFPISRLHLYASFCLGVTACYNTWLHIRCMFDIDRKRHNKPKSSKNRKGERRDNPNELLHSDVSRMVLKFNEKAYLFLMMDNYSRYIIHTIVGEKSNHKINIQHLINAMEVAKQNNHEVVQLLTDQGPENTAKEFIAAVENYGVTHSLAQTKNFPASNSMVERMFASVKKFLRNKFDNVEPSLTQLNEALEEFIQMHNFELPLYNSRKTPAELYWRMNAKLDFEANMKLAQENRTRENSEQACQCSVAA